MVDSGSGGGVQANLNPDRGTIEDGEDLSRNGRRATMLFSPSYLPNGSYLMSSVDCVACKARTTTIVVGDCSKGGC